MNTNVEKNLKPIDHQSERKEKIVEENWGILRVLKRKSDGFLKSW